MFYRTLTAALLMAGATGAAAAQTTPPVKATPPVQTGEITDLRSGDVTVVYDKELSSEFEVSREIIDRVEAEFGESAIFDNGQDLPQGVDSALTPGNMLPEGVETAAVPDQLGDLPTLGQGSSWVAVGEHLVEVTRDNRIVMVVYDALP